MSVTGKRILIVAIFAIVTSFALVAAFSLLLLVFQLGFYIRPTRSQNTPASPDARINARNSPQVAPVSGRSPSPTVSPAPRVTPENTDATRPAETPASSPPGRPETTGNRGELIVPVLGVRPEKLRDTYTEARSEGRTHNALDIMSSCGTPVIAARSGKIIKLFQSDRGGITIYQMGPDNKTVYYYAHLARYENGLSEGHIAQAGEVIGYVGDTGNAGAGNCHLHFAIWTVTDPKRYWDGESINPYPLLRTAP
jgi:murein DD-endopeptidase MepM/ murein hydrolase activator NlpD